LNLVIQESDGYEDCTMEDNMSQAKIRFVCAQYESMVKKN